MLLLVLALLYYAVYVPSIVWNKQLDSIQILPVYMVGGTLAYIASGIWRFAIYSKSSVFSGILNSIIMFATVIAYAQHGAPIIIISGLMRFGVLTVSPIADLVMGTRPSIVSLLALAIAGAAVIVMVGKDPWTAMPEISAECIATYIALYFFRLLILKLAKRRGVESKGLSFIGAEQGVTILFGLLAVTAACIYSPLIRNGYSLFDNKYAWGAGIFAQFAGVFGSMILLLPGSHTRNVTMNRIASVMAAVTAAAVVGQRIPIQHKVGVGLLILAFVVLAFDKKREHK